MAWNVLLSSHSLHVRASCGGGVHVPQCICQRTALWRGFPPSTFIWAPGIKLGSPRFSKLLLLLSRLVGPSSFGPQTKALVESGRETCSVPGRLCSGFQPPIPRTEKPKPSGKGNKPSGLGPVIKQAPLGGRLQTYRQG